MKRNNLYIGVAAAALLLGAGAAFGQTAITQNSVNDASVANFAGSISLEATIGAGASASIGANGAIASVSVSGINGGFIGEGEPAVQNFLGPIGSFGTINQTASNTGGASNAGRIFSTDISPDLGVGASVTVRAGGATAATAISGIADGTEENSGISYTTPAIGSVTQTADNTSLITNIGDIAAAGGTIGTLGTLDTGASVSIGASGAAAATSLSFVNASVLAPEGIGPISQSVSNTSPEGEALTISNDGLLGGTGNLGRGASVSISALRRCRSAPSPTLRRAPVFRR